MNLRELESADQPTGQGPGPPTAAKFLAIGLIAWLARLLGANQFLAILDQAIVSLASFATNLIVARACGQSQFGVYFLALSLLHFVKGIQEQLVSSPYAIYAQRPMSDQRLRRYTGSTAFHQVCILVSVVLILALCPWLAGSAVDSAELAGALRLLIWVCPIFLIREYLRRLSFARFQFRTAFLTDVLMSLLHVGGIAALASAGSLTVIRAYLFLAVASLIGIGYWFHRRDIRFSFAWPEFATDWRMHWGFARFALVTFVVGCSTPFLMPWLVAGLLNEEAAGAYGVCQTIVGVANMLILGVGNFISPLTARVMSQSGSEALWRTLIRANLFFLGILTAFLLLVVSSGTWLVSTLFGADYADLGIPMAILALSQIPAALGVVAGNGLWAIDQPRRNLPADWLTLIATVGSACLLIPQLNLLGAVLAILLGQSLGACCRWWMLIDVIGLPRSNNRPPPAAEISPESVLETK